MSSKNILDELRILQIYQYVNILSLLCRSINYLSSLIFQNLEVKKIWKEKEKNQQFQSKHLLSFYQNLIFFQNSKKIKRNRNPKTFNRIHEKGKTTIEEEKSPALNNTHLLPFQENLIHFPDSKCSKAHSTNATRAFQT